MVSTILSHFPDARVASSYVRIKCPYHKNGQERNPSMGILLQKKGSMEIGTCHCFTCGTVVTFEQLLKDIGGQAVSLSQTPAASPELCSIHNTPAVYKPQVPYRFSPYLQERGITEKTQQRFRVYEKDGKIYMPVFNREGKYLYVNSRSTTSKHYYVEEIAQKVLWGVEELDMAMPIFICEGQIDALSLWEVGLQAVATLGAGSVSSLKEIFNSTNIFVLAFDPDEAGKLATEKAAKLLGKWRCKVLDIPENMDVNSLLTSTKNKKEFIDYVLTATKEIEGGQF